MKDFANTSTTPTPAPVTLADLGLIQITAFAHARIGNTTPKRVWFSYADTRAPTTKTVTSTNITTSLIGSLFGDLTLQANILGLKVELPPLLGPAIAATLSLLTVPLDQLLASLLQPLGIGVGQNDVWVTSIRCDGAVLVR